MQARVASISGKFYCGSGLNRSASINQAYCTQMIRFVTMDNDAQSLGRKINFMELTQRLMVSLYIAYHFIHDKSTFVVTKHSRIATITHQQ